MNSQIDENCQYLQFCKLRLSRCPQFIKYQKPQTKKIADIYDFLNSNYPNTFSSKNIKTNCPNACNSKTQEATCLDAPNSKNVKNSPNKLHQPFKNNFYVKYSIFE